MPSAIKAAKELAKRNQKVETAVSKADRGGRTKKTAVPRSTGVTAEQAKRTERREDGVKTFGAPLNTGANERMRKNQSTDRNN